MNDPVAFVNALRLLGAGMAMIGAIGAGVGVGLAASGGAGYEFIDSIKG